MWVTPDICAGLPGFPSMTHNARNKLNKLSGEKTELRRKCAVGKGFEYHIDCLPPETRVHLLQQQVKEQVEAAQAKASAESAERWLAFQEATESKRQEAARNLQICLMVADLVEKNDMKMYKAFAHIADTTGTPLGTIKRWFYIEPGLKGIQKGDWLPALLSRQGCHSKHKEVICPEAWSFFQGDYLRTDAPTLRSCYERLLEAAKVTGWSIPHVSFFRRRIKTHIPLELRVSLREGAFRAKQDLVPAQRRSRAGLHAMQIVNGDGYTHNLWIRLPNGQVVRPTTWFFQDVYSSMLLSYCVDVSENTDMLGLALHQMVSRYGVPAACVLDRGSAALSQAMSGRMHRPSGRDKKHKKFDSAEVEGAMTAMGIDVTWTRVEADTAGNKGNARAKPIERAFNGKSGLGSVVDKHPAFASATVGDSVDKKPAHYVDAQKNAVSLETFLQVLAAQIEAWNSREGRRTEMAKARGLSYRQVFEESYSQVTIRKPSDYQLMMCLMRTEECPVHGGGVIELKASQNPLGECNRYHSPMLYAHIGTKVSLRFNPSNLSEAVYAYDATGVLIGQIPILKDVAFNDRGGARQQRLAQEDVMGRIELMQRTTDITPIKDVAALLTTVPAGNNPVPAAVGPTLARMMPKATNEPEHEPEYEELPMASGCDSAAAAERRQKAAQAMAKLFGHDEGEDDE
ncbi:transposase domain-containing protein [Aeromonas rivuli]|uniref:transposase domain-containing protein n=1 Tax=Aeromonas rivuli TaxID=648794 RepID=UPI0009FDDA21|nr:transposase domain-containing protein [Aeromonas rivuli]